MSGHSKFSNIKRKKEKNDASRGKIFTKLGREIAVAVKSGGPDLNSNSRLRDVVSKAKSWNMPNDTIERSIKKASGELSAINYEEITYEGYGPDGIAIIIEALTDNKNRTAANIRSILSKYGGNLGTTGCVSFMFKKFGQIIISKETFSGDLDELIMKVIDEGSEDFIENDDCFEILTPANDLNKFKNLLNELNIITEFADVVMMPDSYANSDKFDSMNKILDQLENDDDIQNIWHNWKQE